MTVMPEVPATSAKGEALLSKSYFAMVVADKLTDAIKPTVAVMKNEVRGDFCRVWLIIWNDWVNAKCNKTAS